MGRRGGEGGRDTPGESGEEEGEEEGTHLGGEGSRVRLTASAAAGSARLGSEPKPPVSGTICRTFSTGREGAPSSWAAATPCRVGQAPWGAAAEARPRLGSALGLHWPPRGLACPLSAEAPSPASLGPPGSLGEAPRPDPRPQRAQSLLHRAELGLPLWAPPGSCADKLPPSSQIT